jgi:hypothetical protein
MFEDTFSKRRGYIPAPVQGERESLSADARRRLWDLFYLKDAGAPSGLAPATTQRLGHYTRSPCGVGIGGTSPFAGSSANTSILNCCGDMLLSRRINWKR